MKARIVAVLVVVAALAAVFWWATSPRADNASAAPGAPTAAPGASPIVAFGIAAAVDDRFISEPCSKIVGGGLFSAAAFTGEIDKSFPGAVGISMGDVTQAWGGVGRRVASHIYTEVFPATGLGYVAAGEGELGLGVEFVRETLTRVPSISFLCANAADASVDPPTPLMRGWALLKSGDRGVLIVAVAAESLQAEIRRRGSNVFLAPAEAAALQARVEGLKQASLTHLTVGVSVLLVHGTVDETAAIVAKMPDLTFAVAAHGPTMPETAPRKVGGVPIYYGGQGLRFGWRVLVPGQVGVPLFSSLTRFGWDRLNRGGSPYGDSLKFLRDSMTNVDFETIAKSADERPRDPAGTYAGGARCGDCHIAIAKRHTATRHGAPSKPILDSPFAASTECIGCHMTAPFWDGGWRGPKDRSDMGGISCEACHGPAEAHAAAPKSVRLPKVSFSRCYDCHQPDRSPEFDAEAAWKLMGH